MSNQMRDWDVIEKEQKLEKRYRRITKNAVYCMGGGIGLLLIKTFMPDMGVEGARHFMNGLGLTTLGYGLIVLIAMGFFRPQVFKINFFMMFFIVPAVIIKLLVDTL
jgi:hypothetical protein